jgi:phosphoglycerol transferase MdoB-like AlkP superfamily enzyme
MNSPTDSGGGQPGRHPRDQAVQESARLTHTLFRLFIVAVLGSFFVFQLDVSYLWLTALLTAAGIALGIVVLIRAVKYKESRIVLFGTISGLVVSAVMLLVILVSTVFFNEIRDYQQCVRQALTQQATSACRTQLENSMPTQLR